MRFGHEAAIERGLATSLGQEAAITVLRIEGVIDLAPEVAGGAKPRTNADENAAVETNSPSTLPKCWPASATAPGKAARQ